MVQSRLVMDGDRLRRRWVGIKAKRRVNGDHLALGEQAYNKKAFFFFFIVCGWWGICVAVVRF